MTIGAEVAPAERRVARHGRRPGHCRRHAAAGFRQVRARARGLRADEGEGAGLGLAIAKGIMEAHGGSIAAQSPVANGRGTRIVLTFPRAEAPP